MHSGTENCEMNSTNILLKITDIVKLKNDDSSPMQAGPQAGVEKSYCFHH